ncbi:MAG: hypothetical protein ABI237_04370 [Ginsengibacter sp.]
MSNPKKNKKKKKGCTAFLFVATAIITAAAVAVTIQEGKRIKAENELLSYEVW